MFNNNNNNNKNNNKIDFIEQKLIFFESLSKDMSIEFKKIIEKLVDGNSQVAILVTKQDLRINTLDINTQTITNELKDISAKIDAQNLKQDNNIALIHVNIREIDKKMVELYSFKNIITWTVTAVVFFTGVLASSGWLSPDKIFNKPTTTIQNK
jgi:hypothetical protein